MRILIYEHLTAGAPGSPDLPASLAAEGLAMACAVGNDLAALPGVTAELLLDEGRGLEGASSAIKVHAGPAGAALPRLECLAREVDGVLLIAPELDGLLEDLARRVLAAGGRLLGSGPEAIATASDKLQLAEVLRSRGVRSPEALEVPAGGAAFPGDLAVLKPRRGAGSVGLCTVTPGSVIPPSPVPRIVSRLVPGLAASLLLIVGPRGTLPLRAGQQLLSADGSYRYLGGRIPLSPRLEERLRRLALRAVAAVPGLLGYVGIDAVLDESSPDGSGDHVIEINARLTTSYVGLRALAETNLAEHWLRVLHGEFPAPPRWRAGGVHFFPGGAVNLEPPPP